MVRPKGPCLALMSRPLLGTSASELGVDRDDREPLHSQIARQIRALVLDGRLRPQAKLPSTRALADELKVARATIVEAYGQLLGEGYLETRSGSGTRVAAELPESLLTAAAPRPARITRAAGLRREPARPFRFGLVDWENFPHDDWGRLLGRFWRNPPVTLLEHNDAFGWLPLREAIARHLYEWRGISCDTEQVIVTAGGVDAFDLVARAVLKDGDRDLDRGARLSDRAPGLRHGWRLGRASARRPRGAGGVGRARAGGTGAGGLRHPGTAISDRCHHALGAQARTPRLGGGCRCHRHRGRLRQRIPLCRKAPAGADESRQAGERHLLGHLLEGLLADPPAGLSGGAEDAGWPLPRRAPVAWRAAVAHGAAGAGQLHVERCLCHPHPPHAPHLCGTAGMPASRR